MQWQQELQDVLRLDDIAHQQKKPVTSLNSAPVNLWKTDAADFVFLSSISGKLHQEFPTKFSCKLHASTISNNRFLASCSI